MKNIFILAFLSCIMLSGCTSTNREKVNYKEATGYFVRNDVADGNLAEKITSQEQFDRYFGAGATMAQSPTPIDFSREFVAAVILSQTDRTTHARVDSLIRHNKNLDLYYSIPTGARQSYTIRPASILVIDRKYDGKLNITVNETREQAADSHNAQNSLDYVGTYEGTIPCADCSGIEVSVVLNDNGSYTKTMTYIGKEPNNVFTTGGSYNWDRTGNNITLSGETEPDIYKVEENRIIMLDQNGELITGDLSDMYILQKK